MSLLGQLRMSLIGQLLRMYLNGQLLRTYLNGQLLCNVG